MRYLLTTLTICLTLATSAWAQTKQHNPDNYIKRLNFRPWQPPTSRALAHKGQLRFELGHQTYWNHKESYFAQPDSARLSITEHQAFQAIKAIMFHDLRVGASYTPWEHITLGVAYIRNYRMADFPLHRLPEGQTSAGTNHSFMSFAAKANSLELSGTYHAPLGTNFAYEARTALTIGRGKHTYKMSWCIPTTTDYFDEILRYTVFNHSLEGGLSAFTKNRMLQATLLLNAGYTGYISSGEIVQKQVWEQMASHISKHPVSLYFTPSLLFTFNAPKVFSLQMHIGLPMGRHDTKICTRLPSVGFNLSWRLLRPRIAPEE